MGMWQSDFQGMANHFGVVQTGFAKLTGPATATTAAARMGTPQQASPASTISLLTPAIQNFRLV